MKVCHLTSVHKWNDTRIFYKECISLSAAGYDVSLIVPADSDEIVNGVKIISVKPDNRGRIKRATVTCYRILRKALAEKAKIYHFHDPELIWVGMILKLTGKKVIFDIHENIRAQIKVKEWLPFRYFFSRLYSIVDWISAKLFFLILAEKSYEEIYKKMKANYAIVLNLPEIGFLEKFVNTDRKNAPNGILYVGGVSKDRGIDSIIEALNILHQKHINFTFYCIGPVDSKLRSEMEIKIKDFNLQDKVKMMGHIPIDKAYEYSKSCKLGLSILKPIENYLNSYSTKIFEYMSVGLPVIVSNFELYRFVEEYNCGICVNPADTLKIAETINYLLENDAQIEQMGENGRDTVKKYFNWEKESQKLIRFYKGL